MEESRLVFVILHILVRVASLSLMFSFWLYLKSKPLAMQTFLDEMIKELIIVHFFCSITSDLTNTFANGLLTLNLAIALYLLNLFMTCNFILQVSITFITRYLSIFTSWVSSTRSFFLHKKHITQAMKTLYLLDV